MADDLILNNREDQTIAEVRRPWSAPKVIVSEEARSAAGTFKLTPSVPDYETGTSFVGS